MGYYSNFQDGFSVITNWSLQSSGVLDPARNKKSSNMGIENEYDWNRCTELSLETGLIHLPPGYEYKSHTPAGGIERYVIVDCIRGIGFTVGIGEPIPARRYGREVEMFKDIKEIRYRVGTRKADVIISRGSTHTQRGLESKF